MNEKLQKKIENLPKNPGVYQMLNSSNEIIYVGKAKNLSNRVRSYFHASDNQVPKVLHMVQNIADLRYIICDSEAEALLLECNLIKEHKPYYNILLKDDKSYPFVSLSLSEQYPRLFVTRKKTELSDKYFGPFHNTAAAREAVDAANRIYPLQKCTKKTQYGKIVGKTCLYSHIGQCLGCCTGKVEMNEYANYVHKAEIAFSGKSHTFVEDLRTAMYDESEKLNFESAAVFKSAIIAVDTLFNAEQKVAKPSGEDLDIVAAAFDENEAAIQVFCIRDGKMSNSNIETMTMKGGGEDRNAIIESFLLQYYESNYDIPPQILLEEKIAEVELVEEALSKQRGKAIHIVVPQKGEKARLIKLARANASMTIESTRTKIENKLKKQQSALTELAEILMLHNSISRIEAFDISNIASTFNVGAMVVFENGKKSPKAYRKFRIREVEEQNDYASMSEMVFRRLSRANEEIKLNSENPKFLPLPEIMLIDGGFNHINAIKKIINLFEYEICVCGLVKNNRHKLRALITDSGEEIPFKRLKASYLLLNEISEEVHRSAISYHKNLRSSAMIESELSYIEGVGEKRAMSLLQHFGSIDKIKTAEIDELQKVEMINLRTAESIYRYFHTED